jgi:4'-phosphopantetheinyl transferase
MIAPASLEPGDVHLWHIDLDGSTEALWPWLSDAERARAARFYRPCDRERFVAGRGLMRAILARYLGRAPAEVAFLYRTRGKPALAGADAWLRFNLSHAGGRALLGVAREREVGVDMEVVRPLDALDAVAAQVFSEAERAALEPLSSAPRTAYFYRLWTLKEAFVKGTGDGLLGEPGRFTVVPKSQGPATLRGPGTAGWSLQELPVETGFAAALAVWGAPVRIRSAGRVSCVELP